MTMALSRARCRRLPPKLPSFLPGYLYGGDGVVSSSIRGLQRFPVACSGVRSVWSALSPRRFSFHTTQSGEGSRRSIRCGVDALHIHSEKAVIQFVLDETFS